MGNKINLLKNNVPIEIEYDKTMVFIGANPQINRMLKMPQENLWLGKY